MKNKLKNKLFLIVSAFVVFSLVMSLLATLSNSDPVARKGLKRAFVLKQYSLSQSCHAPALPVEGMIAIPKINLVAPVEEGTSEDVLSIAVGHNSATVLPGGFGTSELSAHDVSQFMFLNLLNNGDEIDYYYPCQKEVTFKVVKKQVITIGQPVWGLNKIGILLETCWPPDTLGDTNERLMVYGQEVKVISTTRFPSLASSLFQTLTLNLPQGLDAQNLTLSTNYAPMGYMSFGGNYDMSVLESSAPLYYESLALELYFGALRAFEAGNSAWLSALFELSGYPSRLVGILNISYLSKLNVLETYSGKSLTSVELTTSISSSRGSYNLEMKAIPLNSSLVILNFKADLI